MKLGDFIASKLRDKGATLYFLAKATKISYPYLFAIENGTRRNPSYEKLKKIAEALDVDMKTMLEAAGFEGENVTSNITETISDKDPQRIPYIPWSWLIDPTNFSKEITGHTFRNFKYTELKDPSLYALDCGKDIDHFVQGTRLVIQLNPILEPGKTLLIKGPEGLGIYTLSSVRKKLIGIPQNTTKTPIEMQGVDTSHFLVSRVREVVMSL